MKKIVALALCLIMALSLATVAFAGTVTGSETRTTLSVNDDWAFYKLDSENTFNLEGNAVTAAVKVTCEDDISEKGVHTVHADKYVLTFSDGTTHDYYIVAKAVANKKLDMDGTVVYLFASNEAVKTSKVVTSKVAQPADPACGEYRVAVYMIGGDAYATSGSNWALYNGEFVQYGSKVTETVQHEFAAKNVTYKNVVAGNNSANTIPVSVKCTNCGKTFAVIAKGDIDKDWTVDVNYKYDNVVGSGYVIVLNDGTAAAGTTTTGVSSAKTFDAGVALYAGMALMSVAGSAVVIGKKKEF